MTAGQMLIYMKSLMDLGTPVEVKSIRWEADFLMRDFRKRIYLMFFPAIEGKDWIDWSDINLLILDKKK